MATFKLIPRLEIYKEVQWLVWNMVPLASESNAQGDDCGFKQLIVLNLLSNIQFSHISAQDGLLSI